MTAARDAIHGSCPACAEPLFGWVLTHTKAPYGEPAVVDRCENCGLAVRRGQAGTEPITWLAEECETSPGDLLVAEEVEFEAPNLASLQGGLGEGRWSRLDADRAFHLTPRAIELLLRKAGFDSAEIRFPAVGPNIGWFIQTGLNAVTFNPDFAREVGAGRLRPDGVAEALKFSIDTIITLLAGILIAPLALIAELITSTFKRSGRMVVRARRD